MFGLVGMMGACREKREKRGLNLMHMYMGNFVISLLIVHCFGLVI